MKTSFFNARFGGTPVARTVLPNGTNVFTATLPTKMVTTELHFPSGAYDEVSFPGAAHFLEHLCFTGNGPDGIHPAMRSLIPKGVRRSAATGYFSTEFSCRGLAVHVASMVEALVTICREPCFTEEQMERERITILREASEEARGRMPTSWLWRQMYPKLIRLHVPVIGRSEHIRAITPEALRSYMQDEYRFNSAAFIAAGGITHDAHVELVSRLLVGNIDTSVVKSPQGVLVPTLFNGAYEGPGIGRSGLSIYFAGALTEKESTHLGLAREILNAMDIGLLFRTLRNERRLVYGVSANAEPYPFTSFPIKLGIDADKIDEALAAVLECLEIVRQGSYSEELFETVMMYRRIFFTTRDEKLDPERLLLLMGDMWARGDYSDIDPKDSTLAATRQQIAAAAQKIYDPERLGVVRWLPK